MLAGHECLCCGAPRFGQGVAARGAANIAVATGGNAPPCLKTPFAQSRWKTFTQSHHAYPMLTPTSCSYKCTSLTFYGWCC
eukprot:scaffold11556_cov19-Tisochrysis_lutea.AAC.2